MRSEVRRFGAFQKIEQRDGGKTIVVTGIVSAEEEDTAGETITAEAMRRAIGPWMRSGPAVREQHDPMKAAGTALTMEVDAAGRTWIEALIVDPVTIAKVTSEPPVLRGFSLGGSVPPGGRNREDPTIIENLTLCEVSLVDRPALESARVTMWKAAHLDESPAGRPIPAALLSRLAEEAEEDGTLGATATLAKVQRERDGALAKAAAAERERDRAFAKAAAVERALAKVQGHTRRLDAERADLAGKLAATEAELARRPKGAIRSVPVAVEKVQDSGSISAAPEPSDDALGLIRRAHARPAVLWDPPRR